MLNDLKNELTRLYPDTDSVRRIVSDADIPHAFIEFEGSVIDVWHRVISQAEARNQLPNLVTMVIKEYPNSPVLQRVYGALLYKPSATNATGRPRVNDANEPNSFADLVRRLEVVVNGSNEWNVEGLVPSVKRINNTIDALRAEVAQLKENQKVNRLWLRVLVVTSFLLLIGVISLGYMQFGGA
jgi:hypothetical protein